MNKKVLTLFLFFTLVTIIGLISCNKCGDNTIYKVVDIYLEETGVQYNTNNQPPEKLYYFNIYRDSIYYSFYGIYIEPEMQNAALIPSRGNGFSFINSAYACDPIPSTTNDRITDIALYANQDFDDSHPKGSNLAEYFDIVVSYEHTKSYQIKYDLVEYLKRNPIVPDEMVLILRIKPKQDTKLRFTIDYKQNGVSFSSKKVEFDPITLLQ